MARKTIEFVIKLFIIALVAMAGLYTFNVLNQMGIIS